jgi:hypothetical protein
MMDVFMERTDKQDFPDVAERYEEVAVRRLVLLCRELQRHKGEDSFYLGAPSAGKLLEMPEPWASRWLKQLTEDGVLERMPHEKRMLSDATGTEVWAPHRYRYRGDDS